MNEEQIKELKKSMTSVYKQLGEGRPLSELAGEEEQVSAYLSHADVTAENLRACSRIRMGIGSGRIDGCFR